MQRDGTGLTVARSAAIVWMVQGVIPRSGCVGTVVSPATPISSAKKVVRRDITERIARTSASTVSSLNATRLQVIVS